MEEEDCSGICPGHPCTGPLSAGWGYFSVAAVLGPSRATCAQAGGPRRGRIREPIHSGFQTSVLVPRDRAGRWAAFPPTTSTRPRESLGHRLEGPPELAVARANSARRPGPSFLPPPRPATARSDTPFRVLRRAPARSRAAGSARRLAGCAARLSLRSALAALLRSGCPGEPRAACAP